MTQPLNGTELLKSEGDLAAQMVADISRFLDREIAASTRRRVKHWKRDFSSRKAYTESVEPNRQRFRRIIGADEKREAPELQKVAIDGQVNSSDFAAGAGPGYKAFTVRWKVVRDVEAEGLLLEPNGEPRANIIALPDCDCSPEALTGLTPGLPQEAQFARRLAENGCRVLIPTLIDRGDTWSGTPVRMTNQPHREFIYRAAFEMGHHLIGFEVQKVLSGVDWFVQQKGRRKPIGVIGHGEGGLLALYSAAADTRIGAAVVSGYFQPREKVWEEPIYRNVFALLQEFGDAEIAGLVAPRSLIVEASRHPKIEGPPEPRDGRSGAAPGKLITPDLADVNNEFERAKSLVADLKPSPKFIFTTSAGGRGAPGTDETLQAFLKCLGVKARLKPSGRAPRNLQSSSDSESRLERQFHQLLEHTQYLMREGEFRRTAFWSEADESSVKAWDKSARKYRRYFWEEVIGKFPNPRMAPNPRSRLVFDEPKYLGYEVMLDVYPDVFAYGILLVPKHIKKGERRPVVVCQHGLEGRPRDVADPGVYNNSYHQYACRLAERGFVTFAPQNPYIGMDDFRVLQRKLNPLKKTLFAIIVRQHERIVEWLSKLPFVDRRRIAFYGLSYGGKTAMRVPAIVEQYCLSICSADYNEWIWKNTSARHRHSYMTTGEYEMFEFDLGNTFNYAEMSWLICPRPFMVERGHHDGVAPDEWVAYEFAKTYRRYNLLGIGDCAEMELFNGPHTINGQGTFEFLHRHLRWPMRK